MADIEELMNDLRAQLFARGASGVKGLARNFRIADDNGNNKLDSEEFDEVLKYCGLFLSGPEHSALFKFFDINGDGNVSLDEFYTALQGQLNDRRRNIVTIAFNSLDRDGSGVLTVSDIKDVYDVSKHPKVVEQAISEEEALEQFLDGFDGAKGNNDGRVTFDEFEAYYKDVGGSVPSDDYFVMMVENAWGIKEQDTRIEERWAKIKDTVFDKCAAKSSKQSPKYNCKGILQTFDNDDSNSLSLDEFRSGAERLGVLDNDVEIVWSKSGGGDGAKLSINAILSALFDE